MNKQLKKAIPIFLVLMMGSVMNVFSQDSLSTRSWAWAGFGYGTSASAALEGVFFGQTISFVRDHHMFSARMIVAARKPSPSGLPTGLNSEIRSMTRLFETSAMYGYALKNKSILMSIAAGLGYVQLRARSSNLSSVAIPLEIQVCLTPTRVLGFGVYLFANLYSKTSYNGMMFFLQIGVV